MHKHPNHNKGWAKSGGGNWQQWLQKRYCNGLVQKWLEELSLLSQIVVTHPQAPYACYVSGYQYKFMYFIQTISDFERYLQPIKDVMIHQFISAITGEKTINDDGWDLFCLPPRHGKLGLKNAYNTAQIEFKNSLSTTRSFQNTNPIGYSQNIQWGKRW